MYTHAKNVRTKQIAKRKLHDRVGKQTQNNKSARGIESLTICTHCYRFHPCHIRLVSLLWSLVCLCQSLSLCVWPKCISTSRQTDWLVLYFTDWKVFVRKKTNRRHQFNIVWSQKKVTVILFFPRHGPMFCLLFIPYIFSICLTKLTMKYFGACGRIKYLWGCTYIYQCLAEEIFQIQSTLFI